MRARELPHFAGVHGTTGYEWMNVITHVLVDGKGLEAAGRDLAADQQPVAASSSLCVKDAKRRVLETLLTSEFTVLTRLLARIANGHYSTRDFSADSLRQALELYVLHFPVYRTYLTTAAPTAHDRALIDDTIEQRPRRMVRRRRRHFRLPARRADHGPAQARPRRRTARRGCAALR